MNLLELKNLLNNIPEETLQKANIVSSIDVGCCGDTEILDLDFIEFTEYKNEFWLKIRYLNSLPGFESCRRYAKTLELHKEYLATKG